MKKLLLLALLLILVGIISFKPFSVSPLFEDRIELIFGENPPASTTGAPGEVTCTHCHSGSTLPADGVVIFSFSGANNIFSVGQSYDITISKPGSSRTGFEMTALDENNEAAGDFTPGVNTSTTSFDGRNYIRHSESAGVDSWTFTWNAPLSAAGDVTFYYALNESNNNNSTIGDQIYLGANSITYDVVSNVLENDDPENSVDIKLYDKRLSIGLGLQEEAFIYYTVQDLSGKQLDYHTFGLMQQGVHSLYIALPREYVSGIYLITVFTNNTPHTSKIALP